MKPAVAPHPPADPELTLLRRAGLVLLPEAPRTGKAVDQNLIAAVRNEWAALGYVAGRELQVALRGLDKEALTQLYRATMARLRTLGAQPTSEPLYRRFPHGVPKDTNAYWWKRVVHSYLSVPDQPCHSCDGMGCTHVLSCGDVVCDRCFDGSNYSACPLCQQPVDTESPFFKPTAPKAPWRRKAQPSQEPGIVFRRLELGKSLREEALPVIRQLLGRPQVLSPNELTDLGVLVERFPLDAHRARPDSIPVKETRALFNAALLNAGLSLEELRSDLDTATDVLRLIAALSGADPALQGTTEEFPPDAARPRTIRRFKVRRLPRSLRRGLLGVLDGIKPSSLLEDMLRHASYWVWVGEFLHPGEYAERFPNAARGFYAVRQRGLDPKTGKPFRTWMSRVEESIAQGSARELADRLVERPGEFARKLDLCLSLAQRSLGRGDDAAHVLARFHGVAAQVSTPQLLLLSTLMEARGRHQERRVFFPKGPLTRGVHVPEERPPIPKAYAEDAARLTRAVLFERFAKQAQDQGDERPWLLDEGLAHVPMPFNERTASEAALDLPRGAHIPVPDAKNARLFLHWCEPSGPDARTTDLDLSVGFYSDSWEMIGYCSFGHLELVAPTGRVAASSGDLQAGPPPDGATECVDIDLDQGRRFGARYAVMVVNAYSGLPFDELDTAFAGLMLRDSFEGPHFDPSSALLKFQLRGARGVFLPLVLDLTERRLHWLDAYSRGDYDMNTVQSSDTAVTTVAPGLIGHFASGLRPTALHLGLLRAAASAPHVDFRRAGDQSAQAATCRVTRRPGETPEQYFGRLTKRDLDTDPTAAPAHEALNAILVDDDLTLPDGSRYFALLPGSGHVPDNGRSKRVSLQDWL